MSTVWAVAETVLRTTAAFAIFSCCLWTGAAIAQRLLPRRSVSTRLAAVTVLLYWTLSAAFTVLAGVGAFRLSVALPMWLGIAAALLARKARWRLGWEAAAADMERVGVFLRSPSGRGLRFALYLAGALAGLRVMRGLVAPPLAWDALTYHLLKSARWVQSGGLSTAIAPDQWGFYEYFLPLGDALWAWAMIATRDDSLLAIAGGLVWLSCLGAAGFAARVFGAERRAAVLAALAIGFLPGVFAYLTASYVEVAVVALFLVGMGFSAQAIRRMSAIDALFSTASFAVLAGIKWNYLPLALVSFGGACFVQLHDPDRRSTRSKAVFLACQTAALCLAMPAYLRAWLEQGNPLYPLAVSVMGKTLLAGNEELLEYTSGAMFPLATWSPLSFARTLFDPTYAPNYVHLCFGPAGPLLIAGGLFAGAKLLRKDDLRLPVFFMLGTAVVMVAALLSGDYFGIYAVSTPVLGRMWAPSMAVFVVLLSAVPGRWSSGLLWLAVATELVMAVPLGWDWIDLETLGGVAGASLVAAVAVRLSVRRLPPAARSLRAAAVVVAALIALSICFRAIRDPARYRYYEAAASRQVFDVHPLHRRSASSWPLWRHFDVPDRPVRLAVAAGWAFGTWNWYLYPLLGSRLQNDIVYIPVSRSGEVIDYRLTDEIVAEADFASWRRRLVDAAVDYVVLLPPLPLEGEWMESRPALFERVTTRPKALGRAYRLRHDHVGAQPSVE